jgi:glutamine synthetase
MKKEASPVTDSPGDVLNLIRDNEVQIVDLRFADLPGLMQHFSVPAHELTEEGFEEGFGFDGSSIGGWKATRSGPTPP